MRAKVEAVVSRTEPERLLAWAKDDHGTEIVFSSTVFYANPSARGPEVGDRVKIHFRDGIIMGVWLIRA